MKLHVLFPLLALFACLLNAKAAAVTTWTWTGGGSSSNWSDKTNWSSSVVPSGTIALSFKGSAETANINDSASTLTVTNVSIDASSSAWNISGNSIKLAGNLSVSGSHAVVWAVDTVLSAASCLFQAGAGTTTISGVLSGAGVLQARGTLLVLSASNSYSGGSAVNAGVLRYDNVHALGTGTVAIFNNSTLQAGVSGTVANGISSMPNSVSYVDTQGNTVTLTGLVSGYTLAKSGAGTLILSNGANSQAETRIWGGTLQYDAIGAPGNAVSFYNTGTLRAGISGSVLPNGLSVSWGTVGIFDTQGYQVVLSGSLSGDSSVSLIKTGAGSLTFTKSSTYSGSLSIAQGMVCYSDVAALGVGNLGFTGNALLQAGVSGSIGVANLSVDAGVTGTFDTAGLAVSTSAAVMGSGTLAVIGNGSLELTNSLNTLSGGLVLSSGTLRLGNGTGDVSFTSGGLSIVNNGAMDYTTYSSGTIAGNISGTGSLAVSGPGILVLSGSNTYTGPTLVEQGELDITGYMAATGGLYVTAATLGGNGKIAGVVTASNGTIAGTLTLGQISLGGMNRFEGNTTVLGDLTVSSGTTTTASQAQVASSAVLRVQAEATYVNNGTTSADRLEVEGIFTNNAVFTGSANVTGGYNGIGLINGSLVIKSEGAFAPGSGTSTVNGALVVESGAKVSMQITSGGHGQIVIQSGSVVLGAGSILDLTLDGSLKAGDVLVLISNKGSSPISGTFGELLIAGGFVSLTHNSFSYNGTQYLLVYNVDGGDGTSNDLKLMVVPEPKIALMLLMGGCLLAGVRWLRVSAGAC